MNGRQIGPPTSFVPWSQNPANQQQQQPHVLAPPVLTNMPRAIPPPPPPRAVPFQAHQGHYQGSAMVQSKGNANVKNVKQTPQDSLKTQIQGKKMNQQKNRKHQQYQQNPIRTNNMPLHHQPLMSAPPVTTYHAPPFSYTNAVNLNQPSSIPPPPPPKTQQSQIINPHQMLGVPPPPPPPPPKKPTAMPTTGAPTMPPNMFYPPPVMPQAAIPPPPQAASQIMLTPNKQQQQQQHALYTATPPINVIQQPPPATYLPTTTTTTHTYGANIVSAPPVHHPAVMNLNVSNPATQHTTNPLSRPTNTIPNKQDANTPWTEHTAPSGLKYYYNSVTKESTYVKPPGFISPVASQVPAKQPQVKEDIKKPSKWVEYQDPNTGKKYYSNGVTTTWEKPANFQSTTTTTTATTNETEKQPKKPKKEPVTPTYSSKEEAIAAFKGLLLAKDITPTMKFPEVAKICSSDPRWKACCKTPGERKQALTEFQSKLLKETKELKREELKRNKETFSKLLLEYTPPSATHWNDVRNTLKKDERFYVIESEDLRQELFYDFCQERKKRDERQKRLKWQNAIDEFKQFLKECYDSKKLTLSSTWSSFRNAITKNEDKERMNNPLLSDKEKELMFSDYIIELQEISDEKHRRIMEARHRAERNQRDNYRSHLRSLIKKGIIQLGFEWRDVHETLEKHETYKQVFEQDVDAPRKVFERLMDDYIIHYRYDEKFLSDVFDNYSYKNALDWNKMTYSEFINILLGAAEEDRSSSTTHQMKKILQEGDWNELDEYDNDGKYISNALFFYQHLLSKYNKNSNRTLNNKNQNQVKNAHTNNSNDDSSEDEGEIKEDGEIGEEEDEEHHDEKELVNEDLEDNVQEEAVVQDDTKEVVKDYIKKAVQEEMNEMMKTNVNEVNEESKEESQESKCEEMIVNEENIKMDTEDVGEEIKNQVIEKVREDVVEEDDENVSNEVEEEENENHISKKPRLESCVTTRSTAEDEIIEEKII